MENKENETRKWQEETAMEHFQLIAPLLDQSLDEAAKLKLRKRIAEDNGVSIRSLYRYEQHFKSKGYRGLLPMNRSKRRSQQLPMNFDELVQEAIHLKREVPERSVRQIITILELENRVSHGVLKRSTLQRYLFKAGFGMKQMQTYVDARQSSSKRFCKPHRMMLVQGDIKYGPKLPIGKNGKMITTYLSSAMDDHSRLLLSSKFYANQEASVVEDTFRTAILRYGKFDAAYFDNGSQYVAHQLKTSLSKLGIRIQHARIRSGKSKGKIEKFHQVVDSFVREVKLKKPKSLEELNHYWQIYLESYYNRKPHDGIREYYESLGVVIPKEGITPFQEFNRDTRPLTFMDVSVVSEAFLYHEQRKVDKGGCISFRGRLYETRPELIGFMVNISYDPASPEAINISYPGIKTFTSVPLKIGSYCDKHPTLPISMQQENAKTSRMLDALEEKNNEDRRLMADALSFANYGKEVTANV